MKNLDRNIKGTIRVEFYSVMYDKVVILTRQRMSNEALYNNIQGSI